jgi:hypothetical protein
VEINYHFFLKYFSFFPVFEESVEVSLIRIRDTKTISRNYTTREMAQ